MKKKITLYVRIYNTTRCVLVSSFSPSSSRLACPYSLFLISLYKITDVFYVPVFWRSIRMKFVIINLASHPSHPPDVVASLLSPSLARAGHTRQIPYNIITICSRSCNYSFRNPYCFNKCASSCSHERKRVILSTGTIYYIDIP